MYDLYLDRIWEKAFLSFISFYLFFITRYSSLCTYSMSSLCNSGIVTKYGKRKRKILNEKDLWEHIYFNEAVIKRKNYHLLFAQVSQLLFQGTRVISQWVLLLWWRLSSCKFVFFSLDLMLLRWWSPWVVP